jgi:ubiquinone/menaquinone biosynthesis C-methylase UbiE
MLQVRAVLDVGTATGRGMANLKRALPDLFVCGVEPVAALIKKGALDGNTVAVPIVCATGEALPFPAESFDVVCDFATLHHAAHRDAIVTEGDGLAIPTASSWTFWPRGRTASY